ncbi:MAG: PKD domain-containing protein [Ginsengibacter sp.]
MNKIVIIIYFLSFTLIVNAQSADFTYQASDSLFCNPSSIQFTQLATGSPIGFVWTFGNGTGSNSKNPLVNYNKAGSYLVKLIVIYGRSTAVVTKTIVINPAIIVSIGYDRNYICTPGDINFTATSSGNIAGYDWDFGDGSGIQTTNGNTIAHNYTAPGVYNISLKATDVSGCYGTNQTTVTFQTPPLTGVLSPVSGCVPANVSFTANATIPANSALTNYAWDFGDGSPITSTAAKNTNHLYASPGYYSPKVTITTSEGCINKYSFGIIGYGTPPFNLVAHSDKTIICGSDTAKFVSKATDANRYVWNFGDGTAATVADTIAKHKYTTLGTKNIKVTPFYNGCPGIQATLNIDVVGVIATYKYSNTCIDKKTFSFSNTSQGNLSSVSWDFGDGSPLVNTLNATHTFPSSGSFVTKVTVTDSVTGCSDTYAQTIYTSDPYLVNPDTSICKNDSTTFSVANNNNNNPANTYTWYVAGKQAGPLTDSSYTVSATIFGNFNNYVVINNGTQYCRDTIRLNNTLLVRGPDLNFTAPPAICLNSLYSVSNTSKPFLPADSVSLWYWNFGVNNVNDTIYQPQPYIYNNPGTYKVKLTGVDINGCKDSLVKNIAINPLPFLYVIPATDTLCFGKADSLIAFHSDSIMWSPSNSLTCAACDTVLANPSATTQYTITATSKFGCTMSDSIFVKVFPPFVAVPLTNDPYICMNDTVQLNVNPPGKIILWSPAAGLSNANNYGPIASPAQTTMYTATLMDSVGCFTSTADITVHVKSLPTVDAGPDKTYPYNTSFSINPMYSANIASYNWTPPNILSCNTCPDPNGIANNSNTFFIEVTSDSGCVAKDAITIYIECKDANILMPTAFTPNSDGLNDYFYPLTRGIKSITKFSIYNRFGKLVYEAKNFPPNDQTLGWNGKVNSADQSTSVFVYYIEAICDLGQKLFKKGSVVLIR